MEPSGLRFLYRGGRRRYRRLRRRLGSGGGERARPWLLLLLLLLLDLLLVLLRDRGHRRRAGLEALLLLRLPESLLWHACRLLLDACRLLRHPRHLRGDSRRLGLKTRVAGILLLQRSLTEAGGLRSERARLLLLLLLWLLLLRLLASSHSEGVPILLGPRAQTIAAEVGIRVGEHDYRRRRPPREDRLVVERKGEQERWSSPNRSLNWYGDGCSASAQW